MRIGEIDLTGCRSMTQQKKGGLCLKIPRRKACRFDSGPRHHLLHINQTNRRIRVSGPLTGGFSKIVGEIQFRYSGAAQSLSPELYAYYRQVSFRHLEGSDSQDRLTNDG